MFKASKWRGPFVKFLVGAAAFETPPDRRFTGRQPVWVGAAKTGPMGVTFKTSHGGLYPVSTLALADAVTETNPTPQVGALRKQLRVLLGY